MKTKCNFTLSLVAAELSLILTHLSRMGFPTHQLGQYISVLRIVGWYFSFSFKFQLNNLSANSGDPDQTPRSVASDLGLHCLPVSHIKDARLIGVNVTNNFSVLKLCSAQLHWSGEEQQQQ